ncbi:M42 family metallopeptidase [Oscillochloris sp. ZM17-4]|uniref:M42 family metallopeptidase n=1 Tax=Oscillochloris sp. ZM17-4 TaxID=2866714 RepID=UPI00210812B8|nr:M42 family metallopeptidase [Oscillochloris sp. ZM17-4]
MTFLKRLLGTPGPSGDEAAAAKVWRDEAKGFADRVSTDVGGNSYALIEGAGPRVLLAGHIDEIGLMVSYIDEGGYLSFSTIGGWDAQVLVAQRVRLLGHAGEVIGVIGKKPIHLLKPDERGQASTIERMWIDIGVDSRDEALERVRVGCVGVIDAPLYELPHGRIVSRALDNRIGAFTVLEALRLLSQDRPAASVAAVATAQEEITFAGAASAAFSFDPQVAIAVDVTFATDHPESSKQQYGDVKLGGGPVLSRGSANSPLVYARLVEVAEREGIAYSLQISPRYTGTDADAIHKARGGVATGVVSIPNRYMHSPNEMVDMADVAAAARLIAAFVRSISSADEFIPAA